VGLSLGVADGGGGGRARSPGPWAGCRAGQSDDGLRGVAAHQRPASVASEEEGAHRAAVSHDKSAAELLEYCSPLR